ncbi:MULTISPECIES: sulfite exporter TauE/SafE family protein [Thermomonosporaceae]|uniref:sulfite exporter TauE/SafE family protein n=1 Tax=Thermomonosporaceae TaxID=2012 RepID=UPI00255B27EC|nr:MULTISPECIES: sulfite exporter TauE/SafE family protein [Thermomonosporaceae]MDL4770759.1 sulfite exporter TauE/SafE family protein [Actinomadura xylanilytica]
MTLALVLAGALIVGATLGLLGAGGSVLAVPVLVYGAGQPMTVAIPTALVVVTVSSLGALVPRLGKGQVRWPVTVVFATGGVPAALAGAAVGRGLPDRLLLPAFALVMIVIAMRMLRGGESTGGACRATGGRVNRRRCLPRALATGAGIGLLTGLLGVGGGFAVVPALTLLLGLPAAEAVATSLVIIVINSIAAFAGHAGTAAELDWTIMLAFAGAALLASLAAGKLAGRLDADRVRRWFAWTILILAPITAAGAFT